MASLRGTSASLLGAILNIAAPSPAAPPAPPSTQQAGNDEIALIHHDLPASSIEARLQSLSGDPPAQLAHIVSAARLPTNCFALITSTEGQLAAIPKLAIEEEMPKLSTGDRFRLLSKLAPHCRSVEVADALIQRHFSTDPYEMLIAPGNAKVGTIVAIAQVHDLPNTRAIDQVLIGDYQARLLMELKELKATDLFPEGLVEDGAHESPALRQIHAMYSKAEPALSNFDRLLLIARINASVLYVAYSPGTRIHRTSDPGIVAAASAVPHQELERVQTLDQAAREKNPAYGPPERYAMKQMYNFLQNHAGATVHSIFGSLHHLGPEDLPEVGADELPRIVRMTFPGAEAKVFWNFSFAREYAIVATEHQPDLQLCFIRSAFEIGPATFSHITTEAGQLLALERIPAKVRADRKIQAELMMNARTAKVRGGIESFHAR